MNRVKKEAHRASNGTDCRKYGESYVKYYIQPNDFVINGNNLFFDTKDIDILNYELVDNEQVLANFLNLGKEIYDKVLKDKIQKCNYMYDNIIEIKSGHRFEYYSFSEFIKFTDWEKNIIGKLIVNWCKRNPFYFGISISKNEYNKEEINYKDINIYELSSLAVTIYAIYSLYNRCIKKINTIMDGKTINNISGLYAICNYWISNHKNELSKTKYIESIKNIDAYDTIDNCKTIIVKLVQQFNLSNTSTGILKDDSLIKLHNTIMSVVIDTIISTFYCEKKELLICKNCGNYYSGHGNSYLCEPCRKWKDNHKHIKNNSN